MPKRSTKFYRKNEAEVMKKFGLKPTKNSGAGWIEKADGQNDFLICELKSTDAQSFRLSLKDLGNLEYHANVSKKVPVFMVQFLECDEVFVVARPSDLKYINKYLETGSCEIVCGPDLDIEETKPVKKKVIKSCRSSREDFWKEKEEMYAK